jgi:transcriptional regulator with XRE-family HTH domain
MARQVAREVGRRLKTARRERRIAQDAFAQAMGVSRTTASNIECGHQRLFLDQIYRAAEILGVPIETLLPTQQHSEQQPVVHAAADDPLSRDDARQVADVARELVARQSKKRRMTRKV